MGAYLGESRRCPFTEQTDRKLVCIIARASAVTDRGFGGAFSCSETKPAYV